MPVDCAQKIIRAVNANGTVHARYSTPSEYVRAKLSEGVDYSIKTDDFFPYISDPQSVWTGYFTSRPGLKGYVRSSSVLLQVARQLEVLGGGGAAAGNGTARLWEALSLAQHHDGVSGTELDWVSADYAMRIASGAVEAYATLDDAVSRLAANGTAEASARYASCPLLNLTSCPPIAGSASYSVALWNPQARPVASAVRLPVYGVQPGDVVVVRDAAGAVLISDVLPMAATSAAALLGNDSASHTVAFVATVPALGYAAYSVTTNHSSTSDARAHRHRIELERQAVLVGDTMSVESSGVQLIFDTKSGLLTQWIDKRTDLPTIHNFTQNFYWYLSSNTSSAGCSNSYYVLTLQSNSANAMHSSALSHIAVTTHLSHLLLFCVARAQFIPQPGTGIRQLVTTAPTLTVWRGAVVTEVTQRWTSWLSQVIRLYSSAANSTTADAVEFEWTVGPVDVSDGLSKEVVTRYDTDIANDGAFATDSNGREFQPRVRNQRPTWNWTNVAPVSGNYYPLSTALTMDDGATGLGVVVDRAQGAASLQDGSVEVMLHRRILTSCGLAVPLNEPGQNGTGLIVTGVHRLFLGPVQATPTRQSLIERVRLQQQRQYFPLHPLFAASPSFTPLPLPQPITFVSRPLPTNVELSTLQQQADGSVLLRLAHSFAVNESDAYSVPVSVDVSALFEQPIRSIRRVTLTANADWKPTGTKAAGARSGGKAEDAGREDALDDTVVTLGPMQIATFVVEL